MKSTEVGTVTRVIGRIPILDVEPAVDCGRRPARAAKGETFQVSATIFREGHGIMNAAVVLRDVNELSYEEMSDALRIPIGTVKSRLSRARNLLAAALRNSTVIFPAAEGNA